MTQSIPRVSIPQAFTRLCVTLSKGLPPSEGDTQQSLIRTYTGRLRPEDQPLNLLYNGGSRGRVRGSTPPLSNLALV